MRIGKLQAAEVAASTAEVEKEERRQLEADAALEAKRLLQESEKKLRVSNPPTNPQSHSFLAK